MLVCDHAKRAQEIPAAEFSPFRALQPKCPPRPKSPLLPETTAEDPQLEGQEQ